MPTNHRITDSHLDQTDHSGSASVAAYASQGCFSPQNTVCFSCIQSRVVPRRAAKTIALYTQDARRFATWLQHEPPGLKATEVASIDAKTYRDHLLAKRYAPTTG